MKLPLWQHPRHSHLHRLQTQSLSLLLSLRLWFFKGNMKQLLPVFRHDQQDVD